MSFGKSGVKFARYPARDSRPSDQRDNTNAPFPLELEQGLFVLSRQ